MSFSSSVHPCYRALLNLCTSFSSYFFLIRKLIRYSQCVSPLLRLRLGTRTLLKLKYERLFNSSRVYDGECCRGRRGDEVLVVIYFVCDPSLLFSWIVATSHCIFSFFGSLSNWKDSLLPLFSIRDSLYENLILRILMKIFWGGVH